MNPLFNIFGNQQPMFPFNMIQNFNQFRQSFQGDPRQQVQNLLNTGQMSQQQFDQLSMIAQQFQQFIGK